MNNPNSLDNLIISPFVVVVDGREKAPYRFSGIKGDANSRHRDLLIPTEWSYLHTGDYSIRYLENVVAVERKSKEDLFSTLGQHRARFEAEHVRMSEMQHAVVVIEANWRSILRQPPPRSRLNPKTIFRTSISWYLKYGVPWITLDDRRLAEVWTYRFLDKVWRLHADKTATSTPQHEGSTSGEDQVEDPESET